MPDFSAYRPSRSRSSLSRIPGYQGQQQDGFSPLQVNMLRAQAGREQHAAIHSQPQAQGASRGQQPGVFEAGERINHIQRADGAYIPVAAATGDPYLVKKGGSLFSPRSGEEFGIDATSRVGVSSLTQARLAADAAKAQAKQQALQDKELIKQQNNEREAVFSKEKRPNYTDAHGRIQPVHTDEEWQGILKQKDAAGRQANEYLKDGRRFYTDKITGQPVPMTSDEEHARNKQEKDEKLQRDAAAKPFKDELTKLELDLDDPDVLPKVTQKDLEDRQEKANTAAAAIKYARANSDYESDLTDEEIQKALADSSLRGPAAELLQSRKELEELPKQIKAREEAERRARQLNRRIKDPEGYKAGLQKEVLTAPPEDLRKNADEIEAQAKQRQADFEQNKTELDKADADLAAQHEHAQKQYEDAKNSGDPRILGMAGDALAEIEQQIQQHIDDSEERRVSLSAEAQEINRDVEHLGIVAGEINKRREASIADQASKLDKVIPGAGARYNAILTDAQKRADALKAQYPDPEAPEAKAAFEAFQKDVQGKVEGITKEAQAKATERADDLRAARVAIERDGFEADTATSMKKSGLDPKNPKHKAAYFDANKLINLERPDKSDWKPGDNIAKGHGSATLSDGALHVNPQYYHDPLKYAKVVEASEASDEEKAKAMADLPRLQLAFAESVLPMLKQAGSTKAAQWIPGIASFQKWQAETKPTGTEAEQASQYLAEMNARGAWSKGADNVLRSLLAGFADIGTMAAGTVGLLTSSQTASEAAADWSKRSNDFMAPVSIEGGDSGLGSAILGQTARMAGPMAATLLVTRGLGGGMATMSALSAAQTAGSQYADSYGQLREQGMKHGEAWKQTAPYALASGMVTAMLTAAGGRTGFEAALGTKAGQKAAKEAAQGFWRNLARNVPKQALAEIPEELPDELFSQISQALATDPNADVPALIGKFWEDSPAFLGSIALMGGAGGVMETRKGNKQPLPTDLDGGPDAPTGPLPEDKAGVQAAIAAFNPTAPEAIQAMPAVIRAGPKNQLPSEITAKARASMGAVAGIASGEITKPSQLTETQMRALGVKLDKGGKLVSAGGANAPAPLIYTRPDKAGNDQIVITDEARDWLKGALTDLAIGQSEAERIQAIENPPAPDLDSKGRPMAVSDWDWEERGVRRRKATDAWFDGGMANPDVNAAFGRAAQVGGEDLATHGMAKFGTLSGAFDALIGLLTSNVDPKRGIGGLYTAPMAVSKGSAAAMAGTTGGGTSYRDGPFILVQSAAESKKGRGIKDMASVQAVLVNDANAGQIDAIRKAIQAVRPDMIVELYSQADVVAAKLTAKKAVAKQPKPAKMEPSEVAPSGVASVVPEAVPEASPSSLASEGAVEGSQDGVTTSTPEVAPGSADVTPAPAAIPQASPDRQAKADSLRAQGGDVVIVQDDAAAEALIGAPLVNKGRRGLTTRVNGKPTVVLIQSNMAGDSRGVDTLLDEELHHAATMMVMDESPDLAAAAEQEAAGMKGDAIHSDFGKLSNRGKVVEAAAAYASGKWKPGKKSKIKAMVDAVVNKIAKALNITTKEAKPLAIDAIRRIAAEADAKITPKAEQTPEKQGETALDAAKKTAASAEVEAPDREMTRQNLTGGALIAAAEQQGQAAVDKLTGDTKAKGAAALKALLSKLRDYNGKVPLDLGTGKGGTYQLMAGDQGWKNATLVVNPGEIVRLTAVDAVSTKHAAKMVQLLFRHEVIHAKVVTKITVKKAQEIWLALSDEARAAVTTAYSVRLVALGMKPESFIGKDFHATNEYIRALVEIALQGPTSERIISVDLANKPMGKENLRKWKDFLAEVLTILKDLKRQFSEVKSPEVRDRLIADVDGLVKQVAEEIRNLEKSIGDGAENQVATPEPNATPESTSGKPVSGSSATVAPKESPKSENASSLKNENKPAFYITEIRPNGGGRSFFEVGVDADGDGRSEKENNKTFQSLEQAVAHGESFGIRNATPEPWTAIRRGNTDVHVDRKAKANIKIAGSPGAYTITQYERTLTRPTINAVREYLNERIFEGAEAYKDELSALPIDAKAEMRAELNGQNIFTLRQKAKEIGIVLNAKSTKEEAVEALVSAKPQSDTKADIPAPETAPTVGETAPAEMDTPTAKPGASAASIDKIKGAFDGLMANPTATTEQTGLPKDRRAAFLDVAESLIDDGVNTPEGLAAALMAARPDGSLRKYSQALWNFFGTIDPSLTGQHDWNAVFAGIDQAEAQEPVSPDAKISQEAKSDEVSSRPPRVEGVSGAVSTSEAAPASNSVPVSEQYMKEMNRLLRKKKAAMIAGNGDLVDSLEDQIEALRATVRKPADTPASGIISDEESARLDALTVNNKDRLDKLSANQLSQLNKELLRQPSSAKRDAILATEHPDDIKAALDVVTKAQAKADTPATAEAKVEEQVQTIAATEGQRDAKEIKKEIASKIEQAIKDLETGQNQAETITFQIPGDGTFQVLNRLYSLEAVLKRVKRINTADNKAPERVKEAKQETNDYALEWGTEASFNTALDQLQEFVAANVEELQKNPNTIVPIERLTRYQGGRSRYTASQKANTSYQPSLAAAVTAWQSTQGSKMPTWAELRDWLGYRARQAGQSAGIEWTPESPAEPAQEAAPDEAGEAPESPEMAAEPAAPAVEETAPEVADEVITPPEPETPPVIPAAKRTLKTKEKIADFGEKIGGARKDRWKERGLSTSDYDSLSDTEKQAYTVKAQVYPKPDYQAWIDAGKPRELAWALKEVYDAIAPKPSLTRAQQADPAQREAALRLYVEIVGKVRDALPGVNNLDDLKALKEQLFPITAGGGISRSRSPETRAALDVASKTARNRYLLPSSMEPTTYTLHQYKEELAKNTAWPDSQEMWQKMFDIRELPVGSKVRGRDGLDDTLRTEPEWQITKSDGRYYVIVSSGHKTREDAEAAAKALAESQKATGGQIKRPLNPDARRTGPDYRNGKDVTGQDLLDTFGFRGGEFGNWTNDADRQQSLNQSFDALHDLARILNVPPKALSLNGELGIAFGARGSGKASAHYEPAKVVINLTRTSGAGALAHEWAHGLDDYFGRMATGGQIGKYVSHGAKGNEAFRAELATAINAAMKSISERQWTAPEYVAELKARNTKAKTALASWLKSVDRETAKVTLTDEHKATVAELREMLLGERLPPATEGQERPNMVQIADDMLTFYNVAAKAQKVRIDWPVSGGGKFTDLARGLGTTAGTIHYTNSELAKSEAGQITVPARIVPTTMLETSQKQGDYWQRRHELFARTFEAFVEDSIRREGNESPYLVQSTADSGAWGNLYPQGDERAATNEAFQKMVDALKTREEDGKVALYANPTAPARPIASVIRSFESAFPTFAAYMNDNAGKPARKKALTAMLDVLATDPEARGIFEEFAALDADKLLFDDIERVKEAKELLPYLENLTLKAPPQITNAAFAERRAIAAEILAIDLPKTQHAGARKWAEQTREQLANQASTGHLQPLGYAWRQLLPIYRADYQKDASLFQQAAIEISENVAKVFARHGNADRLSHQPRTAPSAKTGLDTQADESAIQSQDGQKTSTVAEPERSQSITDMAAKAAAIVKGTQAPEVSQSIRRGLLTLADVNKDERIAMKGKGAAVFFQTPAKPVTFGTLELRNAFQKAATGKSSAVLSIREVFNAAKERNPGLNAPAFMAQVKADYYTGLVGLEPPEQAATVEAAGPFKLRDSMGIESTSMSFLPTTEAEMIDAAERDERTPDDILQDWASTPLQSNPTAGTHYAIPDQNDPLKRHSKHWLTSKGRWIAVTGEHSAAAEEIEQAGTSLDDAVRVVYEAYASRLFYEGSPNSKQMRELRDAAILHRLELSDDFGNVEALQSNPQPAIDPVTEGDTPTTESNRANPGDSPLNRRAAAHARAKYEAEEMTQVDFDELRKKVAAELERDEQENLDDILYKLSDIEINGGGLSIEDQEKVRQLANRLGYRGRIEGDRMLRDQADNLRIANASIGSELARGMGLRRDQFKTPQERLDDAIGNILAPSQEMIRKRTINVKTKKERDAIIAKLIEENDAKVTAILARNGLDQSDLSLSADDRHAMQVALMELPQVKRYLASLPSEQFRNAVTMSMRGYDDDAIARQTGLSPDTIERTTETFRNEIAKPAISNEIKVGKQTFGGFIDAGKNAIKWVLEKVSLKANPTPSQQAAAAASAALQNQVLRILNATIPTKKQRNKRLLHPTQVQTAGGKPITIFVAYNPADWKQVYRVARELSMRDATAFDKGYEYWINGILSGPQTHVVNTASNLLSSAWHYGPQWFASATVNSLVRDPKSTQWGEFRHLWGGFMKGIAPAMKNFAEAWDTEADTVGHQYLNQPISAVFEGGHLDKLGNRGPAFGGTFGRVVRIPGRFLVAMDAFAKTIIMHAEVAAHAFRLGKQQKLHGAALTSFIEGEVKKHGSESWEAAYQTATELTFQDENEITKGIEKIVNAGKMNKVTGLLFKFTFPFVRTPTNIYRAGIRKAGGSAGVMMWRLAKGGFYKMTEGTPVFENYSKAQRVKDVSESIMAGIIWMGLMSFGAGEGDEDDDKSWLTITGSRPYGVANAGERASQLRQEGGSNLIIIRLFGKVFRIPYGRYEPLALTVGTLVDAVREFKEMSRMAPGDQGADKLAGEIMKHVVAQAQDKTFLQGISAWSQLVEDIATNRLEIGTSVAKQFVNGVIPNFIRQPLRLAPEIMLDSKKANEVFGIKTLGAALSNAEPKINEAGKPVTRTASGITSTLFPVATEPSAALFDSFLKTWNTKKPSEQWNPDPITKGDWYVYDPAKGSKEGKVPLTTSKAITRFETMVGTAFATNAANELIKLGYRPGSTVTPAMLAAVQEARKKAITSTRKFSPSLFSK